MIIFTARVELARSLPGDDVLDAMMTALAPHHGVVSAGPDGPDRSIEVSVTLPAEDLVQATATAVAVARAHGPVVAVEVMPERLRDERLGLASGEPDLVSVTQAAALLGISRQAVLAQCRAGRLTSHRVGTTWAIPSSAVVEARDARRRGA